MDHQEWDIHCPALIQHVDALNSNMIVSKAGQVNPSPTKQEQDMAIVGLRTETPVGTSTETRSTTFTHPWRKSNKPV